MTYKIIALEGVCGSGKTTLTKMLASYFKGIIIPELPELNRSALSENIQTNFIKSLSHEIFRESPLTVKINNIDYIFMDRCSLSLLANSYGMCDCFNDNFLKDYLDEIIENVINGKLVIPDMILYLDVNHYITQIRNDQKNKVINELWIHKDRIKKQKKIYQYFIDKNIFYIINAQNDINNVFHQSLNLCMNFKSINKDDFIETLKLIRRYLT